MKRTLLSVLCCVLIFSPWTLGQKPDKNAGKIMFLEGESWLLFEEYLDALPFYQDLLELHPENDNYNYRIGMCYLNIPGEKNKAIDYLEKAVLNINPKYKEGRFKETMAPADAYFYLGHAYRINNELDKAIEAYEKFQEILNPRVYNIELVDEQIQACLNAKKLQAAPLFLNNVNLGEPVNSRRSDFSPVVSGDETMIVFTRAEAFYDALMYSRKVGEEWSEPINMTEQLGVDVDEKCYSTCLSYDGTELYLYKNDSYDGNIYVTRFVDGIWSTVERLNDNINTKYWESHASITKDGNTLYFTSNRKGTIGNLDIYKSDKDTAGNWQTAINLGPKINTSYNEESPFISEDGKTLFFSSYGHFNMGGYDIYYSSLLENGEWAVPLNMGYPINTTDDDAFFTPVQNGIFAYYSQYTQEGLGGRDIYRLEIFSDEHPRKFFIQGIIPLKDMTGPYGTYKVIILAENGDTIKVLDPDPVTGEYNFEVTAGNYKIAFENPGYESFSRDIAFVKDQENSEMILETPDMVKLDLVADLEVNDTLFTVDSDDSLEINLTLETGSRLNIESYIDTTLLIAEEFNIATDTFSYNYSPIEGENIIRFNLTDSVGNVSAREVVVDYQPPVVTEPVIVKPVTESIVDAGKPVVAEVPDKNIRDIVNHMILYSSGDMKNVLADLDPEQEGITSREELLEYIKRRSTDLDYSEEDVDLLFLTAAEDNTLLNLSNNLGKFASGDLKTVLDGLDLQKEGIHTPEELYNYLIEKSAEYTYTDQDILELIVAIDSGGDPDLTGFIEQLASLAQGGLARAIKELDPDSENMKTIGDLLEYLFDNSDAYEYDENDVIRILLQLASHPETEEEAIHSYLALKDEEKGRTGWIFWFIIPAALIAVYIIARRRKKTE